MQFKTLIPIMIEVRAVSHGLTPESIPPRLSNNC